MCPKSVSTASYRVPQNPPFWVPRYYGSKLWISSSPHSIRSLSAKWTDYCVEPTTPSLPTNKSSMITNAPHCPNALMVFQHRKPWQKNSGQFMSKSFDAPPGWGFQHKSSDVLMRAWGMLILACFSPSMSSCADMILSMTKREDCTRPSC